MKKYIQITAGRGPVECARAVTLVARELLKAFSSLRLADCEPHNQAHGCFMSMTFARKNQSTSLLLTSGKARYFGVQPRIPIVRDTNAATGL